MTNKINFEDILPGDVIQIRVNARPGYKGLTHDPMTVDKIVRQKGSNYKLIHFTDSKSEIGHSEGRSEYTLISRPKPKRGIHTFDRDKRYAIRGKDNRDSFYLVQYEPLNGWALRPDGYGYFTRIHPDHYENSLYVGGLEDYHAPEEYVPTFQEQLDELGIIPNEIYFREGAGMFYRFIGDGKAQTTRFVDGWRDLVVDYPHISLIKKGRITLYV